ncbi:dentin sialophosphoprotein-like [Dorcoceras hygrometricum]|uniref:Dentin sialophosphoprotein-like n=1 Tax=Dorcoceras hygrometricum TaxID=472368 RepID=A0A2Z7DA84_9LAMI|nr:dentin sialophosphoprotein-like [Dorcoceras hygrometricum]
MMLRNQCASPRPSSTRDQQQRPASNREVAPMQSARRSGHHARSPRNLVRETSGHRPPIDRAAAREAARMSRPPCAASAHGITRTARGGRLATSSHDPLGITDSACKNQLVVVSVQYDTFNTYISIRSTTIGKSRVARDPIAMHTSWRSNSDIASVTSIGYPRMRASGESSTTKHRLLHASGSHPIPPPNDPKTNQYNQDLGHIHSTNVNHLERPNEGSSIDHQVTIYLHAQNITMFPTNETRYFASQILVSISGGLILILTAQSTRNVFRMHSDCGIELGQAGGSD